MSDLTPAERKAISELWGWGPARTAERGAAVNEAWLAARDFYAAELARLREVEKDWAAYGAGGARREAELDADVDKAEAERDALKAALEQIAYRGGATPPYSQMALAMWQVARAALAAREDTEREHGPEWTWAKLYARLDAALLAHKRAQGDSKADERLWAIHREIDDGLFGVSSE